MKNLPFFSNCTLLLFALVSTTIVAQQRHSCSTFQISSGDTVVIGHNLDDYFTVPGIITVNPRGVSKENFSWKEIRKGKEKNAPRVAWKSKFGSITYSIFGRDLIDGGMNEAGLYVGEMTLFETRYPSDASKPTLYHCLFIQYLLDNFSSVDEAIPSFTKFNIDGHSLWHFFIADKQGNSAIVEFIDREVFIYKGECLPHKILCNTTYQSDLDSLALYKSYGGERHIDITDKEKTKRTVRATELLKLFSEKPKPIIDYSFTMLSLLDLGNNQWQIVSDLSNGRLYFKTVLNKKIKFVDLSDFDFSEKKPKYIDIHNDNESNVSFVFQTLTGQINKNYVRKTWWAIEMGFFGNIFIKPFAVWMLGARMSGYTEEFYSKM